MDESSNFFLDGISPTRVTCCLINMYDIAPIMWDFDTVLKVGLTLILSSNLLGSSNTFPLLLWYILRSRRFVRWTYKCARAKASKQIVYSLTSTYGMSDRTEQGASPAVLLGQGNIPKVIGYNIIGKCIGICIFNKTSVYNYIVRHSCISNCCSTIDNHDL